MSWAAKKRPSGTTSFLPLLFHDLSHFPALRDAPDLSYLSSEAVSLLDRRFLVSLYAMHAPSPLSLTRSHAPPSRFPLYAGTWHSRSRRWRRKLTRSCPRAPRTAWWVLLAPQRASFTWYVSSPLFDPLRHTRYLTFSSLPSSSPYHIITVRPGGRCGAHPSNSSDDAGWHPPRGVRAPAARGAAGRGAEPRHAAGQSASRRAHPPPAQRPRRARAVGRAGAHYCARPPRCGGGAGRRARRGGRGGGPHAAPDKFCVLKPLFLLLAAAPGC